MIHSKIVLHIIHAVLHYTCFTLGFDRLAALILSIFMVICIGHFQNRFADKIIWKNLNIVFVILKFDMYFNFYTYI